MLHDDIAAALPELRAHALSLMVDSCTITRRRLDEDGEPVREMDPVTLELTDVWDEVYAGRCRVQRPGTSVGSAEPVVGEREFGVNALTAQLPLTSLGVKRGDRVEVTAIGPLTDPDLLGAVATVKVNLTKTHATKRTLVCEEVTS